MKFVPNAISSTVARKALLLKQDSPRIMFVLGVTGVVAGTYMACRSTMKLEETLDTIELDVEETKITHPDDNRALAITYVKSGAELVKLYAPSIVIMGGSVAMLTGAHVTLTKRNAALTAAYAALNKTLDEYRERVRERLGEVDEYRLYQGIVTEEVKDGDGKKVKVDVVDPNKVSVYAKFFDESNPNWNRDAEYNRIFLQSQQKWANDMLAARGHIFLNEVYDALGLSHTKAGSVCGWVWQDEEREGDNFVDFGLFDNVIQRREFINGQEQSILLDFNVDGVIFDRIG